MMKLMVDIQHRRMGMVTARSGVQGADSAVASADRLSLQAHSVLERVMIDAIPDGLLLVNPAGRILQVNKAMEQMSGYSVDELTGQMVEIFLPPHMRPHHADLMRRYFTEPVQRPMAMGAMVKLRLYTREGHSVPVDIALSHCDLDGETCVVVFIRDKTHVQRLEDQMRHQVMHDTLTGLANRWQFSQHLERAMAQSTRSGQPLALMLLDLDDFKIVNDRHGHAVGDQVLVEVARRLKTVLRAGDLLARLGGDEFTVLLTDMADPAHAVQVADKLLRVLSVPFVLNGFEVCPSASIGIAYAPQDADDVETLMRYADMAMYQAKAAGRNKHVLYVPEMGLELEERVRVRDRLTRALKHGGLSLHYQPQVEVATGRMVGVEALLRWHDAELGHVPPDRFVPVAESTGLMQSLSDWVLESACRQLAEWAQAGIPLRMAINLSAQQLHQRDLCDRLAQLLAMHGLSPEWLELEITESQAMSDPEAARHTLARLADLGVGLALDDFGTGHSSLSYLKLLPVKRVKIDRGFVRQVPGHAEDTVLVRAILALAHTLGLQVVAEGVETREQLRFLQEQGCDYYQGWFYARAMPAQDVVALLQSLEGAAASQIL